MARAAKNSVVGASTAVWPVGQTQLTVTYTPGRTIAAGNTLVIGDPASLDSEVANAAIQSVTHLDTDHISGVGTVPAALFGPEATRGQLRFKPIVPSEPVVVVYTLAVAPTANRDFPTALAPLDPAFRMQMRQRSRGGFRRAFRKAARRRPSWLRRAGRGIWRRLKNPFGIFGAYGAYMQGGGQGPMPEFYISDSDMDAAVGEVFGQALSDTDNAELDEFLGAFQEELEGLDWDDLD